MSNSYKADGLGVIINKVPVSSELVVRHLIAQQEEIERLKSLIIQRNQMIARILNDRNSKIAREDNPLYP
jgi:hypothetical protein